MEKKQRRLLSKSRDRRIEAIRAQETIYDQHESGRGSGTGADFLNACLQFKRGKKHSRASRAVPAKTTCSQSRKDV